MSYSAGAVANEFIKRSLLDNNPKAPVTNMKVQKLVYIAHGYYLALMDKPLISNDIHAFEWGPVIPVLYNDLKQYGASVVPTVISGKRVRPDDSKALALLNTVWNSYGYFDGIELSRITHRPNTPWSITWDRSKHGVIANELIQEHYKNLLHERRGCVSGSGPVVGERV